MNTKKRRPTHPGELLREEIMPAAKLTQVDLAARMGVSRLTVNEIVNEKRGVSPDLAYRLARVFNTSPQLWLNMQQAVDIWDAVRRNQATYEKIQPLAA